MISRVLEQEEAIRIVLSADRKTTHLLLTWQDIDVLQSLDKALSPLSNLTDILSGDEYVTVSALLPLMNLLDNKFLKVNEEDNQLTKDIKMRINTDLKNRLSSYSSHQLLLLQASSFLDPRFKGKYLDEDEVEQVKIMFIGNKHPPTPVDSTTVLSPQSTTTGDNLQPPCKKRKSGAGLGKLFKTHEQTDEAPDEASALSEEERLLTEFRCYVGLPRLDFEENPLEWWKAHAPSYPLLCMFARRYLCVCATSSSSERLFSSSGHIVSSLRTRLNPDKVNMLTFLAKNLD